MTGYSYKREDLSAPISYSYSTYGGAAFFDEYFSCRERRVKELSARLEEMLAGELLESKTPHLMEFLVLADALSSLNGRKWLDAKSLSGVVAEPSGVRLHDLYLRYISSMEQEEPVPAAQPLSVSVWAEDGFDTEEILKLILLAGTGKSLVEVVEADEVIDRLTRKYDCFQRIFTSYNRSYRKRVEDFENISCYALLAILSAKVYLRENNLRFLNTLLKINDFLSCFDAAKLDDVDILMVITSLYAETGIIRGLRDGL